MADEKMTYVVSGYTGEYSDHRVWYVRSFLSESDAQKMVDKLNAWCKANGYDKDTGGMVSWDREDKPPEDPHFDCDYTGTTYGIIEIPLEA